MSNQTENTPMGLVALSLSGVMIAVAAMIHTLAAGLSEAELAAVGKINGYAKLLIGFLFVAASIVLIGYLWSTGR